MEWDFRVLRRPLRCIRLLHLTEKIMAKKNKEHWGDLVSSLEEKSETPSAEETNLKPAKSRAKAAAARKRTTKKEKAAPPLEKTLLDSFEAADPQLDMTVGAEKPSEKKTRHSRKTEKGLVEKAVAAEEKKERETQRAKREKIAEAIVEKAEEPFRKIASQIEGRIAELSEEETAEADEKPVKKRRAKKPAEPAKKSAAEPAADDFSWDLDETLDVSWGRPPKRETSGAPADDEAPAESAPQEAFDLPDEPAPKKNASAKKGSKISREEAEEKFASLFGDESADNEPVRSATVEDNDFWGIPDEPELGFTSRKKKPEPKPEKKSAESPRTEEPRREERAPRPRREERAPRSDRAPREEFAPQEERAPRPRREERTPRPRRAEAVSEEYSPSELFDEAHDAYNDAPRRTPRDGRRDGERQPREEGEKLFPTWRDAIDSIVHKNISRHGGSSKGGGDRRRR